MIIFSGSVSLISRNLNLQQIKFMKFNYIAALLLGASLTAGAQGYKDGIEYYKASQFDNAITILERNLNDSSTDKALAYYYLGQSYLAKGDKAKAKSFFEQGISANADNPYNYVGLGALDLLAKNVKEAEANFKKAQGLAKKNHEIPVDIARAYYNADPVAYEKQIEKNLQKARKDSKDAEPAIYILEGDRAADAKDFNKAAEWYNQAIYFDEDNPEGYVKYANTYFKIVPQYAIGRLEELLKRQPNSALAQRELAEKYYDNDQWSRAAQQYGQYIKNPNHFPQDKARYAVLLFASEDYPNTFAVAKEVMENDPDNLTLNRLAVRSLDAMKRNEDALAYSTKFFANPAFKGRYNTSDYRIHSSILKNNGQDSLAIEFINAALVETPDNYQLMRELSDIYSDKKDYFASADVFQRLFDADKDLSESDIFTGSLRNLLASSASDDDMDKRTKYGDQGLAMVNKVIEKDGSNPNYLWRKVLLEVTRSRVPQEDAVETINQLLDLLNSNPEYSNPSSKSNYLDQYVRCYNFLISYYDRNDMKDQAQAAREALDKYKALLEQK